MEYRIGNCSSCSAVYKVPASFAHDTAKCKECGGAVQIGPVETAEQKAAPKPPPVPAARVDEAPPKKKRSGPSMKEQLLARRKAEAEAPRAKAPAAKPTAAKPKPAATKPVAAKPRAAAAAPKAPARAKAAGAGSSSSRRSAGKSAGKSGGRSGGRSSGKSRSSARPQKKKSAAPALLGIVGLLAVGGGAAWIFREDLGLVDSAEAAVMAAEPPIEAAKGDAPEGDAPSGEAPASEAPAPETPAEEAMGAKAGDASASMPDKEEAAPAEDPPKEEDDPEEIAADDPNDPLLDLTRLPVYERAPGTTDEEWEQLQGWAKTFLDLDSGAASARSGRYLVEEGRKAFPVLMNAVRDQDLTTKKGRELAGLVQKAFEDICNGINYGWKYTDSVKDAKYNAKVLHKWSDEWSRAQDDIEYWIRMAKLDAKDPERAKALREEFGDGSGGDEVDDLIDDSLLDEF